jgi:hypothetical protein
MEASTLLQLLLAEEGDTASEKKINSRDAKLTNGRS